MPQSMPTGSKTFWILELQELGGLQFRDRVVPMVFPPGEELETKRVRERRDLPQAWIRSRDENLVDSSLAEFLAFAFGEHLAEVLTSDSQLQRFLHTSRH
jgi:hypothetical protein